MNEHTISTSSFGDCKVTGLWGCGREAAGTIFIIVSSVFVKVSSGIVSPFISIVFPSVAEGQLSSSLSLTYFINLRATQGYI